MIAVRTCWGVDCRRRNLLSRPPAPGRREGQKSESIEPCEGHMVIFASAAPPGSRAFMAAATDYSHPQRSGKYWTLVADPFAQTIVHAESNVHGAWVLRQTMSKSKTILIICIVVICIATTIWEEAIFQQMERGIGVPPRGILWRRALVPANPTLTLAKYRALHPSSPVPRRVTLLEVAKFVSMFAAFMI